jgi:hypothetical protein
MKSAGIIDSLLEPNGILLLASTIVLFHLESEFCLFISPSSLFDTGNVRMRAYSGRETIARSSGSGAEREKTFNGGRDAEGVDEVGEDFRVGFEG